jgi:aminopeptidase N
MRSIYFLTILMWYLLMANTTFCFTKYDTLRGSNGSGRSWWDVQHYDLKVVLDTSSRSISGMCSIGLIIDGKSRDSMQIDLQHPMVVDEVAIDGQSVGHSLKVTRDSNVVWLVYPFSRWGRGEKHIVTLKYHGVPRAAVRPPWDGGFTWTRDSLGALWMAVSCQGLGASVWWPCKDAQWDEPDSGMDLRFSFLQPNIPLMVVSNGRRVAEQDGSYHYRVSNPINNYDATFYVGDYIHWHDSLMGEKGKLDIDYYVLRYNETRAREHFKVVKPMLHCFEYWLGPYPFYEDGYKLVEAPYLGMEHQSAIAYGNKYVMGYKGLDRTGTGVGLNFDYIIVHETGHEWFGNSITAKDIADNWIQEGFTTYAECLFVDCLLGKDKAYEYCIGEWSNVDNDKPMIGPYGVNEEGSNDIYDKGAAILHMIRVLTNDDSKFRAMLRGLSKQFYHQTVSTEEVEAFISNACGLDLRSFFNQYLRNTEVPKVEYYINAQILYYRFNNVVNGFSLPITVKGTKVDKRLIVNGKWQNIPWKGGYNVSFVPDMLFGLGR